MANASERRVLQACAFQRPDRIPRFDSFWEFPAAWSDRLGDRHALSDIAIWYPDETPFATQACALREEQGYIYERRDGWGRTTRRRSGAYFVETLEVALPDGADPEKIQFDAADLDQRYLIGRADPSVTFASPAEMQAALRWDQQHYCVFGKTGGPYLRSCYLRGESQFLIDMAGDPPLARAIADKMADHLTQIGLQQLQRWDLRRTGLWIYDDMACNRGPMFSPARFEQVLLPAYRRMIRAYKNAGAAYVFFHSDGDIRAVLEMLVDAGIDGLNPLECRANMDMATVRKQFPRLILTGGMCNTHTLLKGTSVEIEVEAREIIDLARDGGVVIGTHSISPEIPLQNYITYHNFCQRYGDFTASEPVA